MRLLDTIRRLGFLQIDPVSTVAPPQQLVPWSRLGSHDVTELDCLLWEEKALFDLMGHAPGHDHARDPPRLRRGRGRRPGGKQRLCDLAECWYPDVGTMSLREADSQLAEQRFRALGVRRTPKGWEAHPGADDGRSPTERRSSPRSTA